MKLQDAEKRILSRPKDAPEGWTACDVMLVAVALMLLFASAWIGGAR